MPRGLVIVLISVLLVLAKPSSLAAEGKIDPKTHWAFKPIAAPQLPAISRADWIGNGIDYFVLSRLEKEGLNPSPEAEKATLLRRLSLDLLGLPPTSDEVDGFLADPSPDAYEKEVDRLLNSPHYGERYGRFWLDAVGYADSNGYFDADSDRPLAYKYRDYVIRCYNKDKPFDQFVLEQLAGDELCGYVPGGDVREEMVEPLVATHFWRNAPDGTGESDGNPLELKVDRYAVLEGNVQLIGSAFLGLTLQCARCHNHKFEPVTQEEYYQLQAIIRPGFDPEKWIKPNERVLKIGTRAKREENKKTLEQFLKEEKAFLDSREGLIGQFRKIVLDENLAKFEEPKRQALRKALETKPKERSEEMKKLLKEHASETEIKDEDLFKRFPELKDAEAGLQKAMAAHAKLKPTPLPEIAVFTNPEGTNNPIHHILVRGNHATEGQVVVPGVPAILSTEKNRFLHTNVSGRRTALANWLTSPENPVVARVFVNRLWQNHFGRGLVATPDNLGVSGGKPSHPELLDYLASQFINSGWSIKRLQKQIVMSATYRQASQFRDEAFAKDPENMLLWRYSLQRLDAESIRDAILFTTGELNPTMGGPFIPTAKTEEGQYVVNEKDAGFGRRSIYVQQKRTKPLTLLAAFDFSMANLNCTRRNQSTVPLQSLALMNSEFARGRSKAFADAILKLSGDDSQQIAWAFQKAYARKPTPKELGGARAFLARQKDFYSAQQEQNAWTDFCQTLLASSEFLYLN